VVWLRKLCHDPVNWKAGSSPGFPSVRPRQRGSNPSFDDGSFQDAVLPRHDNVSLSFRKLRRCLLDEAICKDREPRLCWMYL